ncbi:hypothetical protein PUN28_018410 [Cardiocondyla obscurior]|uniref:RING-type domain-containing protein n=1 Tax=Cardiocondyla obscurior TaxID=286306 RepID=A0AAW2EDS1_9HYME
MICRDYFIRSCNRDSCNKIHRAIMCTNSSCNKNRSCTLLHLTPYEILEVNENIRPFRETVFNEIKRFAFLIREMYPKEIKVHTCTKVMLGECIWPCLSCKTVCRNEDNDQLPKCFNCFIPLMGDIKILTCGHGYCDICLKQLPVNVNGALPFWKCAECNKWQCYIILKNKIKYFVFNIYKSIYILLINYIHFL